jgi:mannose-6-phosphate isomerase
MAFYVLENTVQKYDWGSTTELPRLLGKDNLSNDPWAELWMGAHPKATSIAVDPTSGVRTPLDKLIADAPIRMLGNSVARRFGNTLPFLFKILSAAKPLSIQVHPSKLKAEHGFAREEFAGIPIDAPERNYKDANHKPETVVALTPFDGLCGFRPIDEIVANIKLLAPQDWQRLAGRLANDPGKLELSVFFHSMISQTGDIINKRLDYALARSKRIIASEPPGSLASKLFSWVLTLVESYPGDVGALAPLVLNLFRLEPGQALNLAAGQPHAYLCGTAAEIMANSDNVLRGGLTSKHRDVPEFISALCFDSGTIQPAVAKKVKKGFSAYLCDVPDYTIAKAVVAGPLEISGKPSVPEILLCTEGTLELVIAESQRIALPKGSSVFVTADEKRYALAGNGTVFRASVPA